MSNLQRVPLVRSTSLTSNHRRIMKIVSDLGFIPEPEISFPPYTVDIYLREFHIAIEYDGVGHNKKRDEQRDKVLMGLYELPVIRFDYVPRENDLLENINKWAFSSKDRMNKVCL